MEWRKEAVTFKGTPVTLLDSEIKVGQNVTESSSRRNAGDVYRILR
jgi:hypothetical protein